VNAHAMGDADVVVDRDLRVDPAIVTEETAFADDAVRFDDRAIADGYVVPQPRAYSPIKHALAEADILAELRGGCTCAG